MENKAVNGGGEVLYMVPWSQFSHPSLDSLSTHSNVVTSSCDVANNAMRELEPTKPSQLHNPVMILKPGYNEVLFANHLAEQSKVQQQLLEIFSKQTQVLCNAVNALTQQKSPAILHAVLPRKITLCFLRKVRTPLTTRILRYL